MDGNYLLFVLFSVNVLFQLNDVSITKFFIAITPRSS